MIAVYIRNVSRNAARIAEIEALAAALTSAGSSLVLAADSAAIAEHAASLGLISPAAVEAVRQGVVVEAESPATEVGEPAIPVAPQDLGAVLDTAPSTPPAAIVIEPAGEPPRPL